MLDFLGFLYRTTIRVFKSILKYIKKHLKSFLSESLDDFILNLGKDNTPWYNSGGYDSDCDCGGDCGGDCDCGGD